MQLPENSVILITGTVAILASILYLREYFLRKKIIESQKEVYLETKQKSAELLAAAFEAESEIVSGGNWAAKKLISEYSNRLQNLIDGSRDSIISAQDQLINFMRDLQKRSLDFEQASKVSTEKRISQTFERLEQKLSDFLIQTEQKTAASIELELKSTRSLIETYKNAQLKLIDENIIAMMEQTLSIVLSKKLSLKDQLDLIYEALEKAKVEKFIV
ncbi:MAG: Uncharacterized protein G01um10147_875 [Microgenomates group bacterium Gr01-1014_7]|nr:MAG: Uncharacterized protein G01um10147_875 [Microgenomates group bacterium Gr01-1014_7]